MSDETTTEQLAEIHGQAHTIQVREGRWRTRAGEIRNVTPTPEDDGRKERYPWWDAAYGGTWTSGGRYYFGEDSALDLVEYLGPIEPDKTQELPDKTQELDGKTQELPEYTPPEGWRVLQVGEVLRDGDVIVHTDDATYATARAGKVVQANQRYIRPIEPKPEPEPIQVREGRWRTRGGEEKKIRPCEPLKGAYYVWPWTDGYMTFQDNGLHQGSKESDHDLVEYLGPIEKQPEPQSESQPEPEPEPVPDAAAIEELRSEVSYVQNLLGAERRRVTQLQELVTSLRNITDAQEKAFTAAGKENTALRNQLAAVKAELASVAADRYRLQVELDAAQQVPADSPELRQLRADLEQVTRERDQYLDSYQRIFGDLETIRETTKAAVVEAIAEWLEPVRLVDSPNLANEALQHLPQIMRHLTGLALED